MIDLNTTAVKHALFDMVRDQGQDVLDDTQRFIALMNDYLPDYDRERRLLKHAINNDVLKTMRREDNAKSAISKARKFLGDNLFLRDEAVEFVIECLCWMLQWNYTAPAPSPAVMQQQAVAAAAAAPAAAARPAVAVQPQTPRVGLTSPARQPVTAAAPKAEAPVIPQKNAFTSSMASKKRWVSKISVGAQYNAIEGFAFHKFSFLKSVELPAALIFIGEYAFAECKRLNSLALPEKVAFIGKGAFQHCSKLSMIRIPAGVTTIEEATFQFCSNLEVVDLPNTISSIGPDAFSGCIALTQLLLTDNVKYIDDTAFANCPSLTIRCYENSYVHKFCQANGVRFELVSKGVSF